MKEIVIISGKGGTGKTSLSASFAYLAQENAIIADCDVDAADMHLLLEPDFSNSADFFSGVLARIQQEKCIKCGECKNVCRFDAVSKQNDKFEIIPLDCEGCGYCARICPRDAIKMEEQKVGKLFESKIKTNTQMIHAKLDIGAENSGKLVAQVKKIAKENAAFQKKELIIVDGSPGVGCPVVSSLSGADYVVLVTEPSVSGIHDLKRVYELLKKFRLPAGCIINKFDLNAGKMEEIEKFLKKEKIDLLSKIPYNENFSKAMTEGKTIVEFDQGDLKREIEEGWKKIKKIVMMEKK